MFDPSWNSAMHQIDQAERIGRQLSRAEQDDLFRQMDKWLADGGLRDKHLLACEVENIYRLRATVAENRRQLVIAEQRITELLGAINGLIADSYGVAGLHQNGDLAPWSELVSGGRFEDWLGPAMTEAQRFLGWCQHD
jgi:hypothetical protein